MEERARVTEADWEDFWYAPEKFGTWHPEDTKNGDDIVVNMDGGVGGNSGRLNQNLILKRSGKRWMKLNH